MMIDWNQLAQPAPEQAEQFRDESAREDADRLASGLRDILAMQAAILLADKQGGDPADWLRRLEGKADD